MNRFSTRLDQPENEFATTMSVVAARDDDVPARRLLAHDMESIVWDDDGDNAVPPPD